MVANKIKGSEKLGWKKGPWTLEEDKLLSEYVTLHGEGRWSSVAKFTGLNRSGKSCRLRWVNYLKPGLKKGQLTPHEEAIIFELHALLGNKWSTIAKYLPGRTDNEIKNFWRTHFKKKDKSFRCNKKQEKRRAKILKHMKQQEQQQQSQDHHQHDHATKSSISSHADHHSNTTETNLCETTAPQDNNYNMELEQYMYEDKYFPVPLLWPEEEDEGLWDTLWNLEETTQVRDGDQVKQCCSKCGMQNQDTTSCFHDFSNNYMLG